MPIGYDNWGKLVGAVADREELRRLAYCDSFSSSSTLADFSSRSSFNSSREDVPAEYSVSEIFLAADSDTAWDKFLPSDCAKILSRSVTQVCYTTKKELYLSLCNTPILLDAGKLSFSLEKTSGKKCYMLCARELTIAWGNHPEYWKWTSRTDSRFSEVAHLQFVCWLDIRGKIKTRMLSLNSAYAAYLVFKLSETYHGLGSANAVVRFVKNEADKDAENRAAVVHLQHGNAFGNQQKQKGRLPVKRSDGWMEIELGSFFNKGNDGDVEARLIEIWRLNWKDGLVVEGIEFRPKV